MLFCFLIHRLRAHTYVMHLHSVYLIIFAFLHTVLHTQECYLKMLALIAESDRVEAGVLSSASVLSSTTESTGAEATAGNTVLL